MGYSRESGTPNFIFFYYVKDNVFDQVSLRTLYRARNLKDEKGEAQIDDYAMAADEKDAFTIFIKQAIYDAFDIVLKMTTGISASPIFIDETIVLDPGGVALDVPHSYGFKIVDEDAYNENNLYTVDDGIIKYVEAHIMAAWYDLVGHADEYAKWIAKRDDARTDLVTKKLFQLRKPLLASY